MVLQKQKHIPHRLDNSNNRGNGRREQSYPASSTANTAPSLSPKRLTRRRARSSPQPRPSPRIPSQESVFSPDLNTSPAFDLMPLEQAQKSPAGASFSEPKNPWTDADELGERLDQDQRSHLDTRDQYVSGSNEHQEEVTPEARVPARISSILVAGTQRRMAANEWKPTYPTDDAPGWEQPDLPPVQLQSNNPFLRSRQPEENPWESAQNVRGTNGGEAHVRDSRATETSDGLGQDEGYIPMTARLSLLDQPPSESPWAEERPISAVHTSGFQEEPQVTQGHPPQTPQNGTVGEVPMKIYMEDGQAYGAHADPWGHQPPAIMLQTPQSTSAHEEYGYPQQQSQQVPDHARQSLEPEINTPAITVSNTTPGPPQDLLEFDEPANPEGHSLYRASSSVYESDKTEARESLSAIILPTGGPPPLPQRENPEESGHRSLAVPSAPLSEAEIKRQNEQKSETYSIRHVNWTDATGKLRQSPTLVQNQNGPCPLLALVNSLVMSAGQDEQLPIIKALQTREQISLGLLIEALFDELTTCLGPDDELPDIEALSRFLTMLHTGMNVNPRLTLESEDAVGSFLQTSDIRLYGTFGIPLVHGWVASPSTETHAALMRVAQYHEDIQLLQFRKEELEDRVIRGGMLTPEEEQLTRDIYMIQRFVEVENATQLSTFGLKQLEEKITPGSVSILFRNDHFSTLYKHPESHKLFTLVTDAGYASHAEIVWESLVDVNGFNAGLFSGDFRPVGHAPSGAPGPAGPRTSSDAAGQEAIANEQSTATTLSPQEQADADYAYALSLQFQEEEQRETARNKVQARNRSASTPYRADQGPGSGSGSQNRFSTSRLSQQLGRLSQPRVQPGKGPSTDAGPPPPYEQATGIQPYGRSQANPYSSSQPGRRPPGATAFPALPDRPKDKNKECIVM